MKTHTAYPCGKARDTSRPIKNKKHRVTAETLMGKPVNVKPVTAINHPEDLLLHCYPAFGAAFVRRIYSILDQVISKGVPLIISIAGPVTVSNQHRAWLIPLIEAGWVAYITTTDAACYHDGHDSLRAFKERPIKEVAIEGMDEAYAKAGVIRVTNTGFKEQILFDQDRMITTLLRKKEFQRRMTGTEFRNLLGKWYGHQEKKFGVKPGLLSTCYKHAVPIFVGAPGDGSTYLNHVKLWALAQRRHIKHKFELDVAAEVFESCAYHYWGLTESMPKQLAILILGGGVPKNFSLQPEPTLSQIFLLDAIRGYDYVVQIVGAPVTDGSLTSCKPTEAHTWGKVSREALEATTESLQADYSTIMPLIAWALIDKRKRLEQMEEQLGRDRLARMNPHVAVFLRWNGGFRLFDKRDALVKKLMDKVASRKQFKRIANTWNFPI